MFVQESQLPFWIEDLRHDGHYQIGDFHWFSRHVPLPMDPFWTDLYTWKRGRFQKANRDFPAEIRSQLEGVRVMLHQFPDDAGLWAKAGEAWGTLGNRKLARLAYKQALRACLAEQTSDDQDRARLAALGKGIAKHLARMWRHLSSLNPG